VILLEKKYSMKEIAKQLNVSRGTIDQVIHNRGRISEETTKKVRDFLQKIEYTPNKVGRGLSKKFNKHVYIIYHVNKNDYFMEVQRGIEEAMNEIGDYGFHSHVMTVDRNSEEQIKLIEDLLERETDPADAIILSPFEPEKFRPVIDKACSKEVPVITFNEDVPDSQRIFHIGMDHYKSGLLAAEVLGKVVKAGKIAVLLDGHTDGRTEARLSGFKQGILSFPDISFHEHVISNLGTNQVYEYTLQLVRTQYTGIFPLRTSVRAVIKALEDHPEYRTGIVTFDLNELMIDGLNKNIITAVICQEPYYQGYLPIKVIFDYFFNHKLPSNPNYQTKLDVIFKWNVDNIGKRLYN
jgi:LacI family transcriptional regulator